MGRRTHERGTLATLPDLGTSDVVGLQMVPVQIPVSLEWCAQPDLRTNLIARFTTVFKATSITSSKDESPFEDPHELGDFKLLSFDCFGTLVDWEC